MPSWRQFGSTHIFFSHTGQLKEKSDLHKTDFKFIGKVESKTNIFWKVQFLLILHEHFSKTDRFTNSYAKSRRGIKLDPNSWLKLVFGLMTPPKEGVFPNIGKNFAEMLQIKNVAVKNVFLFYYMHIFVKKIWICNKSIFYEWRKKKLKIFCGKKF